jgi:hypothetical protein
MAVRASAARCLHSDPALGASRSSILDAGSAQSRNTPSFQITFPEEELVKAQAVSAARLINIQETAIHRDNDFGLPLSHPAPWLSLR